MQAKHLEPSRRNLIIARCGKNSLHPEWLQGGERNWDLWLCSYEKIEPQEFPNWLIEGWKYTALHKLLNDNIDWRCYDYLCIVDEDVTANSETWSSFFDQCRRLNAQLASPSLSAASYFTHLIMMQNHSFSARAVTFVEIMCPCFSREFLEKALPTMLYQRLGAGFGLDFIWPFQLDYRDVWIVDSVAVTHTRPVGGSYSEEFRALLQYELRRTHELGIPWEMRTLGGYLHSGGYLASSDQQFKGLLRYGYAYIEYAHPTRWAEARQVTGRPKPVTNGAAQHRLRAALRHLTKSQVPISRGKPSLISSVSQWSWTQNPALEASGGNDGLLNGSCGFHTAEEVRPWWQVDLLDTYSIRSLSIYNELDLPRQHLGFDIFVSESGEAWECVLSKHDDHPFGGLDSHPFQATLAQFVCGRFVKIIASGRTSLRLDQLEIFI